MEEEEHAEDFEVNEEDYLAAGGLMRIISGRIEHIVDFSNAHDRCERRHCIIDDGRCRGQGNRG